MEKEDLKRLSEAGISGSEAGELLGKLMADFMKRLNQKAQEFYDIYGTPGSMMKIYSKGMDFMIIDNSSGVEMIIGVIHSEGEWYIRPGTDGVNMKYTIQKLEPYEYVHAPRSDE